MFTPSTIYVSNGYPIANIKMVENEKVINDKTQLEIPSKKDFAFIVAYFSIF
jgi:hypothetical protein